MWYRRLSKYKSERMSSLVPWLSWMKITDALRDKPLRKANFRFRKRWSWWYRARAFQLMQQNVFDFDTMKCESLGSESDPPLDLDSGF